ncbi:Sterol uptake control protein 2 [Madurella mycetomatis]|uniref:Sterol uptake control protein 2 n=1 Tax=Madurella mycetomatis TaxID=100816 RepID=A0A175W6Q6_9PEZI|nr:Sterol uptake control protein 2 [Madurella mycetomatis]
MIRRSHKKSRTGCLQCKRRHVKCDESRPICRLCANSNIACSFTSQLAKSASTPASSSTSPSPTPLTLPPSPNPPPESPLDAPLNTHHLALLLHLTNPPPAPASKSMFNLSHHIGDYTTSTSFALQTAFAHPYLLHALLAFSARHLAALTPPEATPSQRRRRDEHLHLAVSLQTRAVSLFNATALQGGDKAAVDRTNCVAVLLFSSVLGHHLFADTLLARGSLGGDGDGGEGLDSFLHRYVQCMEMHRGVYAVAAAAWPLLMATEVGPTIRASASFTSRPPAGRDCDGLREVVEGAAGMSWEEREACRRAIRHLQVGFDAVAETERDVTYRFQMIFLWTMLASVEFGRLLSAKRPEALLLLGHYALLLHYGREMWQVGDAGRYVLEMVLGELGPEWHRWLEVPRQTIARDYT